MSEAEYSLCRNCCLTLGRLKAGSLFACPEHCRRKVRECLTAFRGRGIRFAELGVSCGRRLLLVYDREMVGELLADGDTARFLTDRGYDCSGTAAAVAELRSRVSGGGDFPHEIGVFLGYALDDVKAFIADPCGGKRVGGYWKVYSDLPAKQKLFEKYHRYSDTICGKLVSGHSLLTLFQ